MPRTRLASLFVFVSLLAAAGVASAQAPTSDAAADAAEAGAAGVDQAAAGPVQVYIMMGQSNMLGFGQIEGAETPGTLEHLVRTEGRYPNLVTPEGEWVVRDDVHYVQVTAANRSTPLQPGCGVRGSMVGVELMFGHHVGDFHDEPVLLLKACTGNRSLGWDLLPPGSERYVHDGRTYAGYGDEDSHWVAGDDSDDPYEANDESNWYAGKQWDTDIANAHAVLGNLAEHDPGYAGQGYEVVGFVWWQGHKDQNPAHAGRYEQNLVHLIETLRAEFDAPDAKFVLATIGFGGEAMAGHALTIAEAQLAVSGDAGNYPAFAGNVAAIDARPFWRDADASPRDQGHHYHQNAATYTDVGDALGRAMVELLEAAQP